MINIYISVNATYRKTSILKETLGSNTAQKNRSFPLKVSSVNFVTFTEEILNRKLHFCAV